MKPNTMKAEQTDIEISCFECGKDMDDMGHNYGTEDILVCIHCYQDAQELEKQ